MYYDSGLKFAYAGVEKLKIGSTIASFAQSVRPSATTTYHLGWTSYRWDKVYCATLNESSDAALKENIASLTTAKGLDLITSLNPIE